MRAGDLNEVKKYVWGDLNINNKNLTSLEGCPEQIAENFICSNNYLTSFEYFPKQIGDSCYISNNRFTYLKDIDQHIEYIGTALYLGGLDNIISGYSDLFGIAGLDLIFVNSTNNIGIQIRDIINKYLPTKDIIEFQDEMIKSGYESYL